MRYAHATRTANALLEVLQMVLSVINLWVRSQSRSHSVAIRVAWPIGQGQSLYHHTDLFSDRIG
ncbi:MAG: hypothetical protein F6K65_29860 [Moorea sp. SIO3C2]|nr:hypothetical protein [Moorena sp. SIO3C2]